MLSKSVERFTSSLVPPSIPMVRVEPARAEPRMFWSSVPFPSLSEERSTVSELPPVIPTVKSVPASARLVISCSSVPALSKPERSMVLVFPSSSVIVSVLFASRLKAVMVWSSVLSR